MYVKQLNIKGKAMIILSIGLLLISMGLEMKKVVFQKEDYKISYEYVNIKDMSEAHIKTKVSNSFTNGVLGSLANVGTVSEVALTKQNNVEEVTLQPLENTVTKLEAPKPIWHLPTEFGMVTQNPNYGHVALDITSPRGMQETIFPVANGVISGIYTDGAGAKIVTVLHDVNGKKYTSQYVHLSNYANNIYVGKPVTINDSLGQMGTTGRSTGVHLHLAVIDCALFDSNDPYCSDLNGFFRYANARLSQGYIGLGTLIYVPGEWYSRQ